MLQFSKSKMLAENIQNMMYYIGINSVEELSNRSHVDEELIQYYLSGDAEAPSADNVYLQAIARALTISVEMLFDPNPVRILEPTSDSPRVILVEMLGDCVDRLRQHQIFSNDEIARVVRSIRAILRNHC